MRGSAGPVVGAIALLGVLALAVFPAKAWLDQRQIRRELAAQLATLNDRNRTLEERAAQLQSNEEIERLARQYNLVKPGEEAYFILPRPATAPEAAAPPPAAPASEPKPSRSLWDRIVDFF